MVVLKLGFSSVGSFLGQKFSILMVFILLLASMVLRRAILIELLATSATADRRGAVQSAHRLHGPHIGALVSTRSICHRRRLVIFLVMVGVRVNLVVMMVVLSVGLLLLADTFAGTAIACTTTTRATLATAAAAAAAATITSTAARHHCVAAKSGRQITVINNLAIFNIACVIDIRRTERTA